MATATVRLIGQAICLAALYVGILFLVVDLASVHCTEAGESRGAWIFLTLLSPPILLVPLTGLLLLLRLKRFAVRCALAIGISCAQVLVSFVLFCGLRR